MIDMVKLKGTIYPLDSNNNKGIMTTQIKLSDLLKVYKIDVSINRDINYSRVPKLTKYIDQYDDKPGVFFPSIVCSYSGNPLKDFDKMKQELEISKGSCLIIIDGQHRIKALESYINNKRIAEKRKKYVLASDFTLQVYFGLSKEDMKNLFADINSNSIKVSMSLITAYDSREILNVLTKDLYEISDGLQMLGIEFNKSRIIRPLNTDFMTSVRLKKFLSLLLFGKKILSNKEEKLLKENYDQALSFLERFFYVFANYLPSNPGDVKKYVLGHEAVQNSIAMVLHNEIFTDNNLNTIINWEEALLEVLNNLDWSVNNNIWKLYLIKARKNSANEFYSIDIKDEHKILDLLMKE